ncbi:CoA transferase [Gordonia jinghuaiqii]|uniref:CoA transferase n=1 Tax=Gordonia jinghuaiqii TaxID=2758710 RepID=A0A7D7QI51_9ACTN|nr:CoA transferase [Gordonia jinghuaiqii]MCR5980355.1 CoA transferase [Gordonia jinghuaiqii]QMT01904.1 CoA transferase [Gordonia jinghuaiqii]
MQHKPLEGIRILELGGYISLPYGTSILCALGAEVVKLERPVHGEDFRRQANDTSPYFRQYNTGKRSVSVDLKSEAGVDFVKKLVPNFDVVLENMRPGKVVGLGLGPDACRALRSDVVYGSVTGFGASGPLADRPAYDTIGQAFGGLYSLFGDQGRPQLAGGISADLVTGLTCAMGVLAALVGRLRTGRSQHLETSIMEAVSTLTIDGITQAFELGQDPTRTSRHPQAQNFCVPTSSGEFLAIHLSSSQKFWASLCRAIGRVDLTEDERFATYAARVVNFSDLVPIVEARFAEHPNDYWQKLLTEEDVPFAPVLTMSGYLENEQVEHLNLIDREPDGLALVRPPWSFDGERPERTGRAPRVGADTREIALEVLSDDQVDDLLSRGVLYADEA